MSTLDERDCDYVPVSPELVHKRYAENVWLHNARWLSGGQLEAAYRTSARAIEPRMADLIEVERQAGMLFVLSHQDSPSNTAFVLSSISLQRISAIVGDSASVIGSSGSVTVQSVGAEHDGSRRSEATLAFRLQSRSGAAVGNAAVRILPRAVYERIRSAETEGIAASQPMADQPMTSEVSCRKGLITSNLADPLLSDHVNDHVSAMAMIVSLERDMLSMGARQVVELLAEFHAFVELSEPASFELRLLRDGSFDGTVTQRAVTCVTIAGKAALSDAERR